MTGQAIPVVLQEGEVAAEGQACPGPAHVCCRLPCSWSVGRWPARSRGELCCRASARLSLAQGLHPCPASAGRTTVRVPDRPDFPGAVGWLTPTPQAGWHLQGWGTHRVPGKGSASAWTSALNHKKKAQKKLFRDSGSGSDVPSV